LDEIGTLYRGDAARAKDRLLQAGGRARPVYSGPGEIKSLGAKRSKRGSVLFAEGTGWGSCRKTSVKYLFGGGGVQPPGGDETCGRGGKLRISGVLQAKRIWKTGT